MLHLGKKGHFKIVPNEEQLQGLFVSHQILKPQVDNKLLHIHIKQ